MFILTRRKVKRLTLIERPRVFLLLSPAEISVSKRGLGDASGSLCGDDPRMDPGLKQPMRLVDHLYFVAEHDDHHLAMI